MFLLKLLCLTMRGLNQDIQCNDTDVTFIPRPLWGAQPATRDVPLCLPVSMVVIHHTYIPGVCFSLRECAASMRAMQRSHQVDNGWADIGYNFAVGGNGYVYEGRGWTQVGAHTSGYNGVSIGIVLIGDWVAKKPSDVQMEAAKELIAAGVRAGYIHPEYKLVGHRQLVPTECPGEALFEEINTWDRFANDNEEEKCGEKFPEEIC